MSFVSRSSSNKRRKQTKNNQSSSSQPTASIFAASSPSPSIPSTNLCSKTYTPKQIVSALMEEQPMTVEKNKNGSDVKYNNWLCKNPACNNKVVKCIAGRGYTNAMTHLQSKQCYGGTGTSLNVSTITTTTTAIKQSTTMSSLTFFCFLSFFLFTIFFVVLHLEGSY